MDFRGLRDTLGSLIRLIVQHPDDVLVKVIPHTMRTRIQIHTHPDDICRVVGKGGATINALTTIIMATQTKKCPRVEIDYVTQREHATNEPRPGTSGSGSGLS